MKLLITKHMPFSDEIRGTFYAAVSGMCFGLLGYIATQLYAEHFSIESMLFWRFLIATVWIFIARIVFSQKSSTIPVSHLQFLKIVMLTAIVYSLNSLFYFMAAKFIGTGVAMVIFFCFPVFVTFYFWMTGLWALNAYGVAALVAVVIGMLLLKGYGTESLNGTGVALSLLAGVFYAGYIIISRHQMRILDSASLTLYTCLGNTIFFFILAYFTGTLMLPVTITAWLYILAIGIISTALPIQLLLSGLRYISPTKASILSVLEPMVIVIMGALFLHEKISLIQCIGIVTMLSGAVLIQFEKSSEESEPVLV